MKLYKIWAYCLAMFLMSPTAFCVILSDGDFDADWVGTAFAGGDEESSLACADADGTDYSAWSIACGWETLTNTVDDEECAWSVWWWTFASVEIICWSGETVTASATADIYYEFPPGQGSDCDTREFIWFRSGTTGQLHEDDSQSSGSINCPSGMLQALDDVYAEHTTVCSAFVPEGEADNAETHADATCDVDLWIL